MPEQVIVFDHGAPRQKLMSWFLADSGVPNTHVTTLPEAQEALRTRPRVLILNSTAPNEEIAALVAQIRAAEGGALRIIVLHDGRHREEEALIDADICLHDVHDVEALLNVVNAALVDDIPDEEPHAAGEALAES
jgi:DNA-binding response OmpR family regulator